MMVDGMTAPEKSATRILPALELQVTPCETGFDITAMFPAPSSRQLTLRMAVWTTGSYVLREFSSCVRTVELDLVTPDGTLPLPVRWSQKALWEAELPDEALRPGAKLRWRYRVHVETSSVHGALAEPERLFFSPPALLVFPAQADGRPIPARVRLTVKHPGGNFEAAAALPRVESASDETRFEAPSVAALLDTPVSLWKAGCPANHLLTVEAGGARHDIVVTGAPGLDGERIRRDFQRIFEAAVRFWDPVEEKAPFGHYVVHLHLERRHYGGLEHQCGTALQHDPSTAPLTGETPPENYTDLLRLVSHEYFHAWLVTRLKPERFQNCPLTGEIYTDDLWVFEGITTYFETLILEEAGLVDRNEAWRLLGRRLSSVLSRDGFDAMSLSRSSRLAWVKLYRPTRDSVYSSSSYYGKGALAAMLLDWLELRPAGTTLRKVLAAWFARDREALADGSYRGLPERGFTALMESLSGLELQRFMEPLVDGEGNRALWEERFDEALKCAGFTRKPDPKTPKTLALAGFSVKESHGALLLDQVLREGSAFRAGLRPGDELVVIGSERARKESADRMVAARRGESVPMGLFRGDHWLECRVEVAKAPIGPLPFVIEPIKSPAS